MSDGNGKFAYGKIHWLAKSGEHIEWFDLKSEVFGTIDDLPCKPADGAVSIRLWEMKGSIGLICVDKNGRTGKAWIMK